MQFSMLGVCLDRREFRRGSQKAPDEIRKSFETMETFIGGVDLQDHWMKDLGNIKSSDYNEIESQISQKLQQGTLPIIIGGDHSVTFPAVKAIKPKVFVSFDAHPDCAPGELTAKSVSRKVSEMGIKTVLHGIRSVSKDEAEFMAKNNIKVATLEELKKINEPVYLSIDYDVLDPSIMPDVAYPEPDGLSFKEVIEGVKALAKNLVAIDFVELVPEHLTSASIAGKLIYSSMAEVIKTATDR